MEMTLRLQWRLWKYLEWDCAPIPYKESSLPCSNQRYERLIIFTSQLAGLSLRWPKITKKKLLQYLQQPNECLGVMHAVVGLTWTLITATSSSHLNSVGYCILIADDALKVFTIGLNLSAYKYICIHVLGMNSVGSSTPRLPADFCILHRLAPDPINASSTSQIIYWLALNDIAASRRSN